MSERKAKQRRREMRARGENTSPQPHHNTTGGPFRRERRIKTRATSTGPASPKAPKGRTPPLPEGVREREREKRAAKKGAGERAA
jgi:hypothetical protein